MYYFIGISIPYGAIKRPVSSRAKGIFLLISIPYGAIKSVSVYAVFGR